MNDFPYKGEPAGLVLARLGLPQDTLIKIRRQISPGILRQMSQSLEENANANANSLGFPSEFDSQHNQQQQQQPCTSVSAIMEANQKTFKAECMYSYRIRAESLWGTREDPAAQDQKSTSPVDNDDCDATTNANRTTTGKFSRKRWVSDTDATNLGGGKNRRPADAPNGKADGGGGSSSNDFAGGDTTTTYTDIFPVSAAEPVQAGDVLFLSCAQATMIDFQAGAVSKGLKGLKFLDVSALDLPGHGTEFFEIVLSGHNHFVGRSASRDNAEFAAYYNVSVVAVRRRGQATATIPASASVVAASAPPSSLANTGNSFKRSSMAMMEDAPEVFLEEGVEPALNPDSRVVSPSGSTPQSRVTGAGSARPRSRGRSGGGGGFGWGGSAFPRSPMASRLSRKTTNAQEEAEKDVTESSFKAGDVVLVLAKEEFMEKYCSSRDFFLLTKVGSVPKPVRYFDYLPLLAFLGMLIWVLLDADMVSERPL